MSTSIQTLGDITSFKWATVTAVNPVSIRLDGDTSPLALIPDSLIDPTVLIVGDRVRVELSLRKCVIHGSNNGRITKRMYSASGVGLPSGTVLNPGFQGYVVNLTTPANTPAGELLVSLGMQLARFDTSSIAGNFHVYVDGATQGNRRFHSHGQAGKLWPSFVHRQLLSAGSHVIGIFITVDSGSAAMEGWDADLKVTIAS